MGFLFALIAIKPIKNLSLFPLRRHDRKIASFEIAVRKAFKMSVKARLLQ